MTNEKTYRKATNQRADFVEDISLRVSPVVISGFYHQTWGFPRSVSSILQHPPFKSKCSRSSLVVCLAMEAVAKIMDEKNDTPSGELTFCHGKIHHLFMGKIHYFYGHLFHCKTLVHQRVT